MSRFRLTCFCKPDLDTVLAGCILDPDGPDRLLHLDGDAGEDLLADPDVLCLECGGSGRTAESDFDHHGDEILPCAAEQAWTAAGAPDSLAGLVRHVACVDTGRPVRIPDGALPLSALFGGMRLCHAHPADQFRAGTRLLLEVIRRNLPPEDLRPLPAVLPEAGRFAAARRAAAGALAAQEADIRILHDGDIRILALITPLPGAHGLMRRAGAGISVAGCPAEHGMRWTISAAPGREAVIRAALPLLDAAEPGWGGPAGGGIIGGPRGGSRLSPEFLARILLRSAA